MYTKFWKEDDSEGASKCCYVLGSNHLGSMFSVLDSKSFPIFFRSSYSCLVVVKIFIIFSFRVKFASLWKLRFEFWKCLEARIALLFLLSLLWLFNLILKKSNFYQRIVVGSSAL